MRTKPTCNDCGNYCRHCGVCHRHTGKNYDKFAFSFHKKSDSVCIHYYPRSDNDLQCKISEEVIRAESIHPDWPNDPIHAAAIMMEEAGEVVKAVNDAVEKGSDTDDCKMEAIHTAAMCIRFLKNFDSYKWNEVKE